MVLSRSWHETAAEVGLSCGWGETDGDAVSTTAVGFTTDAVDFDKLIEEGVGVDGSEACGGVSNDLLALAAKPISG